MTVPVVATSDTRSPVLQALGGPGTGLLARTVARVLRKPEGIFGTVVLSLLVTVALLAPQIAPHDPLEIGADIPLAAPSGNHWFGTDDLGRDVLSRVIFGARISLSVSFLSALAAFLLAVPLGMMAGYLGGNTDAMISRLFDTLFAFPGILIGIALAAALGAGILNVVVAVAIINIPSLGRLTRVAVMAQKHQEYILAGRALGATQLRIISRHILPNIIPPLMVQLTVLMAGAVLLEAAFSVLGLGSRPPSPSWGTMLDNGRNFLAQAPWLGFFPGLAITMMILGLNALEDALRVALNPRSQ
jgi:peptide/nickel transport system permease protein/oligopeptide transport system permease protein